MTRTGVEDSFALGSGTRGWIVSVVLPPQCGHLAGSGRSRSYSWAQAGHQTIIGTATCFIAAAAHGLPSALRLPIAGSLVYKPWRGGARHGGRGKKSPAVANRGEGELIFPRLAFAGVNAQLHGLPKRPDSNV